MSAEIKPVVISGRNAYSLKQVQLLLGRARTTGSLSYTGMENALKKNNIERFQLGFGNERYCWAEDIDALLTPRPVK